MTNSLRELTIFAAMRILMVCLGNICRSPLAEGILQEKVKKAGLDWVVDSAGTNHYHTGDAPHPLSQKIALINGIDISQQRARRFTTEDLTQFDKIYALAGDVLNDIQRITGNKFDSTKVDLLLNEQYPGKNLDVPDPYYGGEPDFHEVFELLDEVCDQLILKYQNNNAAK
jgi:protein-tyrosine phosphatase